MSSREHAEHLLRIVDTQPEQVLTESARVIADAEAGEDWQCACIALRARALALAYSENVDAAVEAIEGALGFAQHTDDTEVVGGVEMTAGALFVWAGRTAEGLASLERAATRSGIGARANVQLGAVLYRLGRYHHAVEALTAASEALDKTDREWWSRLETNLGISLAAMGRVEEALGAMHRSVVLDEADGRVHGAAIGVHNLGWISAMAGDLPAAFQYFDEAAERAESLGLPMAERWRDRAEALLVAGIHTEAAAAAAGAVRVLERNGHRAGATEARLKRAEALLAAGESTAAAREAGIAASDFGQQDRPGWAAYARYLALRAGSRPDDPGLSDRFLALVEPLELHGFSSPADQARLSAVRAAVATGDLAGAESILAGLRVRRLRLHLGPQYWLARTELASARGDRRGAMRSARAGLALVEDHRAALGSSEARALVSRNVDGLVRLGVEVSHSTRRPRRLFEWVERGRAGSLRLPRVMPSPDAPSAALVTELRSIERSIELSPVGPELERAVRRRARIEANLRARSRSIRGRDGSTAPVSAGEVLELLEGNEGVLTAFAVAGQLVGLLLHRGRVREMAIGSVDTAVSASREVLRRLDRLARRPGPARVTGVAEAMTDLDGAVSLRLPSSVETLVVLPPPELAALPWSMLPSLGGRLVAQAPSATAAFRNSGLGSLHRVVSLAGPGLMHAETEAARVASQYARGDLLTGPGATSQAVLEAIDGADVGHFACHGSFRFDSPMFSSFQVTNGSLYLHEMERLPVPPSLLVLSACDLGASAPVSAGEGLGPVTALLASGVTTVVASPVLVPDDSMMGEVFESFHRNLSDGARPVRALADAKTRVGEDDTLAPLVGAMQCHGGW